MSSFIEENATLQRKSSASIFWLLLAAVVAHTLYGAIWRLYLSPLAHIPGPWFAKLTFWNEFYYDVVLKGRYTWKIADYHAHYGSTLVIDLCTQLKRT